MMYRFRPISKALPVAIFMLAALLITGCVMTSQAKNLATVSSTSPSSAVAGSANVTIAVLGSNFGPNAAVLVNGTPHATTFVSKSKVTTLLTSADLAQPGSLQISIDSNTNGGSSSATSPVEFTVVSPVQILTASEPAAVVQAPYSVAQGVRGGTAPYTWRVTSGQLPSGLSLSSSGTISGAPIQTGKYPFAVQVTDSSSAPLSAIQSQSISVSTVANPLAINPLALPGGITQTSYATAASATGGTTPYTWSIASGSLPPGLSLNASTGAIVGTPSSVGTFNFGVQVTDSSAAPQTASASTSILIVAPLRITTASIPTSQVQTAYAFTLTSSGGTPPYIWSVASGTLPPGLSLASTGVISGMPTTSGSYSFAVRVDDPPSLPQTATQQFATTTAAAPGPLLAISAPSFPGGIVNNPYGASLSATGGTPPYSWSITAGSLPAGVSLNVSTGAVSGVPTAVGTSNFTVQAKDSSSSPQTASASASVLIVGPLQIVTLTLPTPQLQTSYSATLVVSGGMAPYVWSLSSGSLPPGLSLNSSAGVISGTPTTAGSFAFTVQVTDPPAIPQTSAQSYAVSVSGSALQIVTTSLSNGQIQTSYNATLVATGGVAPYTWSIIAGALPTGLSLNVSTGQISGVPTSAGTYSFTVQAKDSNSIPQTVSAALSIVLASALQVVPATLPNPQVNAAYNATITATGGVAPYAWSISSGSLPAGLSLNGSTGAITGTPNTPGISVFTVQVADPPTTTQTVTQPFALSVQSSGPQITTSAVPNAQVQVPYSATLSASGGTAPYSWSMLSGSLPGGLTLNASSGVISGTATAAGSSSFTVQVADSGSPAQTSNQALSVTVSTAGATDWPVHAGGNIQAAINSAALGDTVTIDVATYTARRLNLPPQPGCNGSQYITIRSANYASLPPAGSRVGPSDAVNMPKLVTQTDPAIINSSGCYYLLGLEITNDGTTLTSLMIDFTGGTYGVLDRSYIHPHECPNTTPPYNTTGVIGIIADGANLTIENNYFDCFWGLAPGAVAGATAQATVDIQDDVGPGPLTVSNNYLNAWYNNMFSGGADTTPNFIASVTASTATTATLSTVSGLSVGMTASFEMNLSDPACPGSPCWASTIITNISGTNVTFTSPMITQNTNFNPGMPYTTTAAPLTTGGGAVWEGPGPDNITFTRNYLDKNAAFAAWQQNYGGTTTCTPSGSGCDDPKAHWEVKGGKNLDIEANVIGGWPGTGIAFNVANQNGGQPWNSESNLTLKNNWFQLCYSGIRGQWQAEYGLGSDSDNILVENNLWTCTAPGTFIGDLQFFNGVGGIHQTYVHNTVVMGYPGSYTGSAISLGQPAPGYPATPIVTVSDNIFAYGNYGAACGGGIFPTNCWPSFTEHKNLIVQNVNPPNTPPSATFPNSVVAASWAAVLFSNPTINVWSLQTNSPGYHAASDGTDIGVDWNALQAALAGVVK